MSDETQALALPDEVQFKRDIQAVNRFQQVVHANLVAGQDYGVIPGTGSKPTLLKPGAEKIAKLLGLADTYDIADKLEDWSKPFFRYLIRATLTSVATGKVVSQGLGECNSMESKYRWRESQRKCPQCGKEAIIKGKAEYGGGWLCFQKKGGCGAKFADGDQTIESQTVGKVENDDIYSLVNTILKMAKKRALVDAALSAGRLSNVFTQDVEDLPNVVEGTVVPPKAPPQAPKKASNPTPKAPDARLSESDPADLLLVEFYATAKDCTGMDTEQAREGFRKIRDVTPEEATAKLLAESIERLKADKARKDAMK